MEGVLAKGTNFVYAKEFISKEYGQEMWGKVLGALQPSDRKIWSGTLLVNDQIPFGTFKAMVSALSRELGKAEDSETARLYEYIADRSLNVLYKVFFKFANPSFVIKNYPVLWNRFFNAGKVEVSAAEKGHAIVRFILPEIFWDWLQPACLGYSKKAVEMAGGTNLTLIRQREASLTGSVKEFVYELNWDE